MTATLDDVSKKIKQEPTAEESAAREMVRRAREQGLSLTAPDGLLKQLTKTVLETALNEEMRVAALRNMSGWLPGWNTSPPPAADRAVHRRSATP